MLLVLFKPNAAAASHAAVSFALGGNICNAIIKFGAFLYTGTCLRFLVLPFLFYLFYLFVFFLFLFVVCFLFVLFDRIFCVVVFAFFFVFVYGFGAEHKNSE